MISKYLWCIPYTPWIPVLELCVGMWLLLSYPAYWWLVFIIIAFDFFFVDIDTRKYRQ